MRDLFETMPATTPERFDIAAGAVVLRGRALADDDALLAAIDDVARRAPFRRMVTPGGFEMSVEMTNCGRVGWLTDRRGYRYDTADPLSGAAWPAMPAVFTRLARGAAADGGYDGFVPDGCLMNRYVPGTRLSLHQDRNERDYDAPIVSVSLGLPAIFQFGGAARNAPTQRIPLYHGDVVVWGGASRLAFHGVLPLKAGEHPKTGGRRFNLTFRKAL